MRLFFILSLFVCQLSYGDVSSQPTQIKLNCRAELNINNGTGLRTPDSDVNTTNFEIILSENKNYYQEALIKLNGKYSLQVKLSADFVDYAIHGDYVGGNGIQPPKLASIGGVFSLYSTNSKALNSYKLQSETYNNVNESFDLKQIDRVGMSGSVSIVTINPHQIDVVNSISSEINIQDGIDSQEEDVIVKFFKAADASGDFTVGEWSMLYVKCYP